MRIDVEDVLEATNERRLRNLPELKDIEFFKEGKRIEIPLKDIEEWEFTGLTNDHFVSNYEWPSLEDIETGNF